MADVHSTGVRSYNMSQIRGKDTKPELLVRKFSLKKGLRYRLHDINCEKIRYNHTLEIN
ncbi:MAG: hypothetical protein QM727_00250 [Niabella sp.]